MLARLPRLPALFVALLFAGTLAWCFLAPGPAADVAEKGGYTDLQLYHDTVTAMANGTPYYEAAAQTQRAHGYPLRPFVTVREPTLYVAAARLGWDGLQKVAIGLVFAAIAIWAGAQRGTLTTAERLLGACGIALGGLSVSSPGLLGFTELWTGLLLALALGCRLRWPERWWLPLLATGAALALRELALPFALLALAFAVWERRWREVTAWAALIALFALGMALHAQAQMATVLPGDIASPGWSGGQGLRGFLMGVAYTSVFQTQPQGLALALALLPALGWASLSGRGGLFAQLLFAGYALLLALFSRTDNFYWGFLVLPAWFAGFALVPRAVAQLAGAIRGRRGDAAPPSVVSDQ